MLLELDFSDAIPVYRQIRNQIVRARAEGGLAPGERLPTVRALASECGINVMTASKAYQLLKQEGHVRGDRHEGHELACVHAHHPSGQTCPRSPLQSINASFTRANPLLRTRQHH